LCNFNIQVIKLYFLITILISPSFLYACGGEDPCLQRCAVSKIPCISPNIILQNNATDRNYEILFNHYFEGLSATEASQPLSKSKEVGFSEFRRRIQNIGNKYHLELNTHWHTEYQKLGAHPSQSNNYSGALQLIEAAVSEGVTAEEISAIILLREELLSFNITNVGNSFYTKKTVERAMHFLKTNSQLSSGFADYIAASKQFYAGKYEEALTTYISTVSAQSSWVSETSTYMVARCKFVLSQAKWSGSMNSIGGINQTLLGQAKNDYKDYLIKYPHGMYAHSAKGIQRRISLLQGDPVAFHKELETAVKETVKNQDYESFISLLGEFNIGGVGVPTLDFEVDFSSPILTSYYVLNQQSQQWSPNFKTVNSQLLKGIKEHKGQFDQYPGLYSYMTNTLYSLNKNYKQVLDSYLEHELGSGNMRASNLIVFAQANDKLGRTTKGKQVWLEVVDTQGEQELSPYLQRAITTHLLLTGDIKSVVDPRFKITDEVTLRDVFENITTNKDLEAIMETKSLPPETSKLINNIFLTRLLLQKQYQEFIRIYFKSSQHGIFEQVVTAVQALNKNPDDGKGLLNVGYFLLHHNITPPILCRSSGISAAYVYSHPEEMKEKSLNLPFYADNAVNGLVDAPYKYFLRGLSQFSSSTKSEVEAKLLHYSIVCFSAGGIQARCTWGTQNASKDNSGKIWWTRLHEKYPDSKWAKKSPYYFD